MIQPQIILLKEGTDTSQGTGQLISNINACAAVANILRSTLGPMGMDKLIKKGDKVSITNDGATIIQLLDIVHPAAKSLVEVAQSQDKEIGDGTTSVVLLASELLKNAKEFIEDGVAPQTIVRGYRLAAREALKELNLFAIKDSDIDLAAFGFQVEAGEKISAEEKRKILLKQCAKTALTSKLIEGEKEFFSEMIVSAFLEKKLSTKADDFFCIKTVSGGSVKDSFMVDGVAFQKTFSYAGFEQQPKRFTNPKIALLNVELELKTEHISAEVRVNPSQYKSIVDAEWKILYDKLDAIAAAGSNIVLSKLPIGDLATQYFAEKAIFCAGRVQEADMRRLSEMTGVQVQTSLRGFNEKVLGRCASFEEKQIGKERMNFFYAAKISHSSTTATLVLRGGAEQYIDEASRSLNDAVMIVKNAMKCSDLVAGGGAVEMELSKRLKSTSQSFSDKNGLFVAAFARALEVIPRTLALNAGLDATDILNELRSHHHNGEEWFGVDAKKEAVGDMLKRFVWEPLVSKKNIVQSATEAACLVLLVDETIEVPRSQSAMPRGGPGM